MFRIYGRGGLEIFWNHRTILVEGEELRWKKKLVLQLRWIGIEKPVAYREYVRMIEVTNEVPALVIFNLKGGSIGFLGRKGYA